MSDNSTDITALQMLGKVRRQLNLLATQYLKPFEIGPKQAILLRELFELESASLSTLASRTFTDPAAAGRAIDTLIKRGWVKQSDDNQDRRRWRLELTKQGLKAAGELEQIHAMLAADFCKPFNVAEKKQLLQLLTESSKWLDTRVSVSKD